MAKRIATRRANNGSTRKPRRKRGAGRPQAGGQAYGLSVHVEIEERSGPGRIRVRGLKAGGFVRRPGERPRLRLLAQADLPLCARRLACLAHPRRLAIARAVLSGADTHHALSRAVGIRTGPLYFHLRHLEREGLLTVHQRERYELTPLGRDLVWIAFGVVGRMGEKGFGRLRRAGA